MSFSVGTMKRSDGNPLDLNNLPDDYPKQVIEDTPSSAEGGGYKKLKKISGGKDYDQSVGKVYECRFCSLKFGKSQALGGHMNRHRQERETETLHKARQLVFGADSRPPPSHHLGVQALNVTHGGGGGGGGGGGLSYHQQMRSISSSSPPALYPTAPPRLFPAATTAGSSYPSNYHNHNHNHNQDHHHHPTANQCYTGHVIPPHHANPNSYAGEGSTNYTCIGAPVGQSLSAPTAARTGPGQMN